MSSNNQTSITVHDLKTIKNLIDLAAQKGIISPSDMVKIGTVYEKVDLTVKDISSKFVETSTPDTEVK